MTRWWWQLSQWATRLGGSLFWDLRVSGLENIPRVGGCLLAANHQSYLDPPLVASVLPREMHFMARRSLFRNPVFRALIVRYNAFAIDRDRADVKGVKSAIERLEAGNILLVFPEGTRTRDGSVGPMKAGIGVLAERAAVPIVPVLIAGAHKVWPKGRLFPGLGSIRMSFGKPILAVDGNDERNLGERLREALNALKRELKGCRIAN
ncbi:MAG TPA: lysophospholipid acyltransferase family protein [Planctomycetota bacterium]